MNEEQRKKETIGNECDNLRLDEYKNKMVKAINNFDPETGHINCDNVLCELLRELGFGEIVDIWEKQDKLYS